MIHFTTYDVIVIIAAFTFPYVAAIAIPVALAIFIVPALRGSRTVRRSAWGILAVVAALGIVGGPFIIYVVGQWLASHEESLRRDTLTEPRAIDGNVFPVGAKLQIDQGGHVEWGELPTPTLVNGLPLIGFFRFVDGIGPRLAEATLARASVVEGVPCAAGPIEQAREGDLTCRLSEDFEFLGYPLAANSTIVANPSKADDKTWKFKRGTLAKPLTLLRVIWPAGTIVKPGPLCGNCVAAATLTNPAILLKALL